MNHVQSYTVFVHIDQVLPTFYNPSMLRVWKFNTVLRGAPRNFLLSTAFLIFHLHWIHFPLKSSNTNSRFITSPQLVFTDSCVEIPSLVFRVLTTSCEWHSGHRGEGVWEQTGSVVNTLAPGPWAPLTVLLYEATGTLQMEKEDHPGLPGWPHLIAGTLTAEGPQEGSGTSPWRRIKLMQNRRNVGGLWGESSAAGGQPARKQGLQSHNCKELISDNTQMSLEASSPSEHPGRNRNPLSPWFWSCETLAEKQVQPRCTQTSDLQNCDGISEHCFKLLNV